MYKRQIFVYPSWNETVGNEEGEQKGGKSYGPGRRPRRADHCTVRVVVLMALCGLTERSAL